jgi:hypothetical protein
MESEASIYQKQHKLRRKNYALGCEGGRDDVRSYGD